MLCLIQNYKYLKKVKVLNGKYLSLKYVNNLIDTSGTISLSFRMEAK